MWAASLIVSVVLLIGSIGGVIVAYAVLPTEVEEDIAVVNYEHQGRFDYLVELKPSYLYGPEPQESPTLPPPNPQYPVELIDSMVMNFSYESASDKRQPVTITALLENPGIWQKEVTLVSETIKAGDFRLTFPIDISELDRLFDAIDEDTGISSTWRSMTLVAHVGTTSEVFELPMNLGTNLLEIDSNLLQTYPESTGEFDYVIQLKGNTLFDTDTLKSDAVTAHTSPSSQPPTTLGPGEPVFSKLVQSMEASFHYDFKSDQAAEWLTEEVVITATLEDSEFWRRTFVLVPSVTKSESFIIRFPLDIGYLTDMLEAIRQETGVRLGSPILTVKAEVHTVAQTDYGPVDEVFTQTMSTSFGSGVMQWDKELVKTMSGSITTGRVVPNSAQYMGMSVKGLRNFSVCTAGIFYVLFMVSVVQYVRLAPAKMSLIEEEALLIRRKYGKRIAEAAGLAQADSEESMSLDSIEDLIKVADELLKPVLHKAEKERHTYCVFDVETRYEYLLAEEPPSTERDRPTKAT